MQRKIPMKNNMTNDMMRLRSEIATLRDSRSTLMANLIVASEALRQDVAQLLSDFASARIELSRQTNGELQTTVLHVKESFNELRQSVLDMRRTFQDDIAGARQTCSGESVAPVKETVPSKQAAKTKTKKR